MSPSLRQLLAARPAGAVEVSVGGDPRALDTPLPAATAAAVDRAVGEALRNVGRHSGTTRADVTAHLDPGDVLAVRVVDHGRGLPAPPFEGYGIARSVRGPVEGVGGEVELSGTPGGGTTVVVRVPAPAQPRSIGRAEEVYRSTVMTAGGSISLVRAVAWPQGLVWSYLGLTYSLRTDRPAEMLTLLAVLVVVTALVAWRLEQGPMSRREVLVVGVVLAACQAVGLSLLPPGGMLDFRSWAVGFVAVPVMSLGMLLPLPWALAVALPQPVIVLGAFLLDPALTQGQAPIGSLNSALSTAALGMVIGILLRSSARRVEEEQRRLDRAQRVLVEQRALSEVSSLHLEHTRRAVVPWLDAVAAGELDPTDPEVRRRARLLALEVRDDLYAPGFLDPDLRRRITEARARGAVVEVGAGFAPGSSRGPAAAALRGVATALGHGDRLTMAVQEGEARLSLVPPRPAALRALQEAVRPGQEGQRVDVDVDDVRAVLRFPEQASSSPDPVG